MGTRAADNLTGTEGKDVIAGLGGDDVIDGLSGNDRICGDEGNDTIRGSAGVDLLLGGDGDDALEGGEDKDVAVFASSTAGVDVDLDRGTAVGEGSDTLESMAAIFGSRHDDTLTGDASDNFLFGVDGNDRLTGGGGVDFAIYWFAPGPVTVDLSAGTATGDGDDSLSGISGVAGSPFDDNLLGDAADNFLDGDAGNDLIDGGDGDDMFVGRAGDDTFHGGPGAFDRIDFRAKVPITLNLQSGTVVGEGNDQVDGIEGAGATNKNDVLTGDEGTDYLVGRGGPDRISGADGDDFLHGKGGRDRVDGGRGTDACRSFEASIKNCEKKTESPEHPLEESVAEVETFRRNF